MVVEARRGVRHRDGTEGPAQVTADEVAGGVALERELGDARVGERIPDIAKIGPAPADSGGDAAIVAVVGIARCRASVGRRSESVGEVVAEAAGAGGGGVPVQVVGVVGGVATLGGGGELVGGVVGGADRARVADRAASTSPWAYFKIT